MTVQLTLGDCDPSWDDLADLGAEEMHDPVDPRWHDLRGQGITARQYHRITDVQVVGEWL